MRVLTFLSVVIFAFSFCRHISGNQLKGNGVLATQEREVGDFKAVTVHGSVDVVVAPGTVHSVKVEGDKNLLEYVEVNKRGETIIVKTKNGYSLHPRSGLKVHVTAPDFTSLEVAGSGNVRSLSKISGTDKLSVKIMGSGDVNLALDAPKVDAEINGSGTVALNGNTERFSAGIRGSGDVHGFNLLSEYTVVDIAGSGNADVFASKQLNIEIKGSGDVRYKGTAAVDKKIFGSGDIRKVE